MMIERQLAVKALKDIVTITADIEQLIRIWPKKQRAERKRIELYQERNQQVFSLYARALDAGGWSNTLEQEIVRFLLAESSTNGLMNNKLGCLYAADLPHGSISLAYVSVLEALVEVRTVPILLSELRAFNALGQGAYSKYQSLVAPVEAAFRDTIKSFRFGKSDTLLAIPQMVAGKERLVEFAEALRRRILEWRHTMGLPDAVNFGISIAHGECKFELLTGEPVPDSLDSEAPAWYQAAKLLVIAEKLSKHQKQRGGAILMTDEADDWFGKICTRKRMSEFDTNVKEEEDYELNIFDGFGSKAHGK